MSDLEPKLTGEERDQALADLASELRGEITEPQPPSKEMQVLHYLTEHPDKERHMDVYEKLFPPIKLHQDIFTEDPYSPTPGDPERAAMDSSFGASMYTNEALVYMFEKVDAVKGRLEKGARYGRSDILTDDELNAVRREIALQHDHEVEKNSEALDRLRDKFLINPYSISPKEADLIEKVRGTSASSQERLELLALHPEIDAIEDMKLTCFMDYVAYADALSTYRNRLWDLNEQERLRVSLVPSDKQIDRPRNLDKDTCQSVKASKTVIAEIYDRKTGRVFEAVEKTNWYTFDPSRPFDGVIPHIVDDQNQQPIYTQVYFRIKRDRENEEDPTVQQGHYDLGQLLIIKDGIRRYIEDL